MAETRQTSIVVIPEEPKLVPGCEVCTKLQNLWLTGEWVCPRCHGPSPDVAVHLRSEYAKTCGRSS